MYVQYKGCIQDSFIVYYVLFYVVLSLCVPKGLHGGSFENLRHSDRGKADKLKKWNAQHPAPPDHIPKTTWGEGVGHLSLKLSVFTWCRILSNSISGNSEGSDLLRTPWLAEVVHFLKVFDSMVTEIQMC